MKKHQIINQNIINCHNLIGQIINCPNVDDIYKGLSNPCEKIVNFQRSKGVTRDCFKGPEPWNGEIDKSKILIISSNPSIGAKEVIPTKIWDFKETVNFYQHRFNTKRGIKWVKDLKGLQIEIRYDKRTVSNWTQTVNRIKDIFGAGLVIGSDYTLLELVHCKSTDEYGVNKAIKECTDRFFDKIMGISPAKFLIVTGSTAIQFICNKYHIQKKSNLISGYGLYGPFPIVGIDRLVILLPHTNYRGKRKADNFISYNDKQVIKIF